MSAPRYCAVPLLLGLFDFLDDFPFARLDSRFSRPAPFLFEQGMQMLDRLTRTVDSGKQLRDVQSSRAADGGILGTLEQPRQHFQCLFGFGEFRDPMDGIKLREFRRVSDPGVLLEQLEFVQPRLQLALTDLQLAHVQFESASVPFDFCMLVAFASVASVLSPFAVSVSVPSRVFFASRTIPLSSRMFVAFAFAIRSSSFGIAFFASRTIPIASLLPLNALLAVPVASLLPFFRSFAGPIVVASSFFASAVVLSEHGLFRAMTAHRDIQPAYSNGDDEGKHSGSPGSQLTAFHFHLQSFWQVFGRCGPG